MLTNNDNCGTPQQNLQYESESCFYAQGRDLKNLTNLGNAGIGVFNGKFNDIAGLRNLNYADASMDISLDAINKVIEFKVNISATPGNSLTLNPDGLFATGGSGTPSGPTGAIQFNDAGSFGGEADLHWDKTNDRLGVGTDTPECTVDVRSGGTGNTRGIQVTHYDNTTAFSQAKFIGRRARGSVGSPAAVQADDTLASFNARGRHDTGWSNTVGGAYIYAAENWTNTATGTYLTWRGIPTGSTTVTEWMRLNQSGLRLASLAGVGTRMVVADINGDLSTQAIPSGDSLSPLLLMGG